MHYFEKEPRSNEDSCKLKECPMKILTFIGKEIANKLNKIATI